MNARRGQQRLLEEDETPAAQPTSLMYKFIRKDDLSVCDLRHAFVVNFKTMVDDLDTSELLLWCVQLEILSLPEMNEMMVKETRFDKNFHFLCIIYRKANADPGVLNRFKDILITINTKSGYLNTLNHIIERLGRVPVNTDLTCTSVSETDTNDVGHWHALLQTMESVICSSVDAKHILPDLISREVITVSQSEQVYSGTTSEMRTTLLLKMIRYCSGTELRNFFEVLQISKQIPQTLNVADLLKQRPLLSDRKFCIY